MRIERTYPLYFEEPSSGSDQAPEPRDEERYVAWMINRGLSMLGDLSGQSSSGSPPPREAQGALGRRRDAIADILQAARHLGLRPNDVLQSALREVQALRRLAEAMMAVPYDEPTDRPPNLRRPEGKPGCFSRRCRLTSVADGGGRRRARYGNACRRSSEPTARYLGPRLGGGTKPPRRLYRPELRPKPERS